MSTPLTPAKPRRRRAPAKPRQPKGLLEQSVSPGTVEDARPRGILEDSERPGKLEDERPRGLLDSEPPPPPEQPLPDVEIWGAPSPPAVKAASPAPKPRAARPRAKRAKPRQKSFPPPPVIEELPSVLLPAMAPLGLDDTEPRLPLESLADSPPEELATPEEDKPKGGPAHAAKRPSSLLRTALPILLAGLASFIGGSIGSTLATKRALAAAAVEAAQHVAEPSAAPASVALPSPPPSPDSSTSSSPHAAPSAASTAPQTTPHATKKHIPAPASTTAAVNPSDLKAIAESSPVSEHLEARRASEAILEAH